MGRTNRGHHVGRAAAIDQPAPPVRARRYLGFLLPRPPGAGWRLGAIGGRRPVCSLLARMAEIGIPRRHPWPPPDWPCDNPLPWVISSAQWRGVPWLGGDPWQRLTNKPETHCLHLWKSKRLSRISTAAKAISSTLWTASKPSCRLRAIQSERPRKPLHRVALNAGWRRPETCRPPEDPTTPSREYQSVFGETVAGPSRRPAGPPCREPVRKHTGFLSSGGPGRLPTTRPTRGADPRFFRWWRGRETTRDFLGAGAGHASGRFPGVNHRARSASAAASFRWGVGRRKHSRASGRPRTGNPANAARISTRFFRPAVAAGRLSSAAGRPIGKVEPIERREWWPCSNA